MDRTPPPSAGGPIPPLFVPCAECNSLGWCNWDRACAAVKREQHRKDSQLIRDELDRRDRELARQRWQKRRQLVEDVILTGLVVIGGLAVLRWILDATGVSTWLGWW